MDAKLRICRPRDKEALIALFKAEKTLCGKLKCRWGLARVVCSEENHASKRLKNLSCVNIKDSRDAIMAHQK